MHEGEREQDRIHGSVVYLFCFGPEGGVFLGACFLDLFPEVKETMSEAISALGLETDFPIPEFVMVYGLFIVLATEQIVVQYQERGHGPALAGRNELFLYDLLYMYSRVRLEFPNRGRLYKSHFSI